VVFGALSPSLTKLTELFSGFNLKTPDLESLLVKKMFKASVPSHLALCGNGELEAVAIEDEKSLIVVKPQKNENPKTKTRKEKRASLTFFANTFKVFASFQDLGVFLVRFVGIKANLQSFNNPAYRLFTMS